MPLYVLVTVGLPQKVVKVTRDEKAAAATATRMAERGKPVGILNTDHHSCGASQGICEGCAAESHVIDWLYDSIIDHVNNTDGAHEI